MKATVSLTAACCTPFAMQVCMRDTEASLHALLQAWSLESADPSGDGLLLPNWDWVLGCSYINSGAAFPLEALHDDRIC